ncbi:MAG TPA: hypothetical protein VIK27_10685, partial [Candidatus Aquilonibacter sp.]
MNLPAALLCVFLVAANASGFANPLHLVVNATTSGTADCAGRWVRVMGVKRTGEPSVLDAKVGAKTPPNAVLYCRGDNNRPGRIRAHPSSLVYPVGTLLQPVYRVTIDFPKHDDQTPYILALGPGGKIAKAPFGQAIIFGKHQMLIVPDGWAIHSSAVAIEPLVPGAQLGSLGLSSCQV